MAIRGAEYPRQPRDTYITPREPIASLLTLGPLFGTLENKSVCDPCCGNGALMRVLEEWGYHALGFDIEPWGPYTKTNFLTEPFSSFYGQCDIVTNPPYGTQGILARKFIERALSITSIWRGKVAMLLPMDYDSGSSRRHLFKDCTPFKYKIVLCYRIHWFGDQGGEKNFAWYVWDWKNTEAPTIIYGMRVKQ